MGGIFIRQAEHQEKGTLRPSHRDMHLLGPVVKCRSGGCAELAHGPLYSVLYRKSARKNKRSLVLEAGFLSLKAPGVVVHSGDRGRELPWEWLYTKHLLLRNLVVSGHLTPSRSRSCSWEDCRTVSIQWSDPPSRKAGFIQAVLVAQGWLWGGYPSVELCIVPSDWLGTRQWEVHWVGLTFGGLVSRD